VKAVSVLCSQSVSRLARNGRDWHTLMNLRSVGAVIVDERHLRTPPSKRSVIAGHERTVTSSHIAPAGVHGSLEAESTTGGSSRSPSALKWAVTKSKGIPIRAQAIGLVFTRFAEMQSIASLFLSSR
jgi:hypothetical protein